MVLSTIDRYIALTLLKSLILFSLLIVGIVWLSQSLRFLELIVQNNIGFSSYLYLIFFLLPDLLSNLLPICLLLAGIQVYQKLIADH